jgi:hypothetical protein
LHLEPTPKGRGTSARYEDAGEIQLALTFFSRGMKWIEIGQNNYRNSSASA